MARTNKVKIVKRSLGPYYFDKAKADAAVEFFPRFFCHVDGEWAGKPFELAPHQVHDVRQIFGWRRRKNGFRRYRAVRKWIPRKNGKTTEAAGIAHLMTIGDGEPGAQVYFHALDGKQSAIGYDMAARMVALSPALSQIYTVTKTGMMAEGPMSFMRWLSGEAYGKHGLNPHAIIGDEAHAWRDGKLHTFLVQGMGARRQPMDYIISTAGEINTAGHDLYRASKAILLDPTLDPETYVSIYEAAPDDDWTDPKVWAKANPNLDVSLKREFLEAECKRALQTPRLENDFKRYHLNLWVEQAVRWLAMKHWPRNTERPNDKEYWKQLPALMKGRKCFSGIDLGSTSDLSAKVDLFPPDNPDGRYVLIPRFWMPEDNVKDRDKPEHPYGRWVADAFEFDGERRAAIETTPGNVTDYDFIVEAVMRDASRYSLQKVGLDALFQGMQVGTELLGYGVPIELMRQGHLTLGGPTLELERLFDSGQLEHGNHPVLEWMFRNAVTVKDSNGNIKPDKKRASEKIDGVVCVVEALGLIHKTTEPPKLNAYETIARSTPEQPAAAPTPVPTPVESDADILKDPHHPQFAAARERFNARLAMADTEEDF
jgi:phage terminase large subunit-like protein